MIMLRFLLLFFTFQIFMGFSQKKWSLQECIEYAHQKNLQIVNSNYNKEVKENIFKISKKEYLPTVSGNFNHNTNFGQSRDIFGNVRRNDNYSNNTNISSGIQIYNGGRIQKVVEKSQYDVDAAQFDIDTNKNNIAIQIAQAYLQILLNKEIYKIAQSSVENSKKLFERAKLTTEIGTTPLTIQYEAQANLSRDQQRQQTSRIDIERAVFNLAQLLQFTDYKNFDVEDIALPPLLSEPDLNLESVLENAQSYQPQIKAAELKILSAKKQTEIVKTNLLPNISANASIGSSYFNLLNTSNNLSLFEQYKNNFGQQFGISVSIPVFNKGITKLQIEQSKINEKMAEVFVKVQKLELKQNIQKLYFDSQANYQNYIATIEAEKSSQLAYDFAKKSYEAGKTSIYDLNISRNNLISVQSSLAQTKYNW